MSAQFTEYTYGDTLYRVEHDLMKDSYRVVGYTEIAGFEKRLGTSVFVRGCDVDHELEENGLPRNERTHRDHCALRLGMIRLKPQIEFHKKQLLGEDDLPGDLYPEFEENEFNVDPVLKKALEQAELERREREEAARIAQEKRQAEQESMESSNLWGAF